MNRNLQRINDYFQLHPKIAKVYGDKVTKIYTHPLVDNGFVDWDLNLKTGTHIPRLPQDLYIGINGYLAEETHEMYPDVNYLSKSIPSLELAKTTLLILNNSHVVYHKDETLIAVAQKYLISKDPFDFDAVRKLQTIGKFSNAQELASVFLGEVPANGNWGRVKFCDLNLAWNTWCDANKIFNAITQENIWEEF